MKHFIKDLGMALEEAKAMSISLPGLALVSLKLTGLGGSHSA